MVSQFIFQDRSRTACNGRSNGLGRNLQLRPHCGQISSPIERAAQHETELVVVLDTTARAHPAADHRVMTLRKLELRAAPELSPIKARSAIRRVAPIIKTGRRPQELTVTSLALKLARSGTGAASARGSSNGRRGGHRADPLCARQWAAGARSAHYVAPGNLADVASRRHHRV